MQNTRIVVLDCETSTINNGREPACRYYMQKCVVQDVACTEQERNTKVFDKLDEILKTLLDNTDETYHYTHVWLKSTKMKRIQADSFENRTFDEGFTIFWRQLQELRHYHTSTPKHEDAYKNEFTKHALKIMSTAMPWGSYAWKFLQHGREQHFYYDQPVGQDYEHAEDTTIVDFDIENGFHRDEVVRVCFGPHILSIGILQFDIHEKELQIVPDQGNPYYQEFRQTPHYVHSTYVQQIHHLTAEQLRQSTHDISSLHTKLASIVQTDKNLIFVAHNAQQDRKWILQSIDDQVKYYRYLACKSGRNQDATISSLHELQCQLKNQNSRIEGKTRRWFCTFNGSMNDDGKTSGYKNGAKGKMTEAGEYTLDALYKFITGKILKKYHNALIDTCACTLIYCRLFKLDQTESADYNRICRMCSDSDTTQRPTKVRKRTLQETGRSNAGVFSKKRQYDIYIDNHKLPVDFVTDENTQVGETIHLEFGGTDHHENRIDLVDFNQNGETRIIRSHDCNEGVEMTGNLGGAYITFRLKDDAFGRRVEICTGTEYLVWRVLGENSHNLDEDLPHLTEDPLRLDSHTMYEIKELRTQETIVLKVIDLHPTHTPSTAQLPSTRHLLTILYRLCL